MSQITSTILMIEPVKFTFNKETAENNYFQEPTPKPHEDALQEFKGFVELLRQKNIEVITIQDTLVPHSPDSIFPNNWVSFHEDGTVALYPMYAENRRIERRMDVLEKLEDLGFYINTVVDYTSAEEEGIFLEGTGSMILDRENKIAYLSISERSDEELFIEFCEDFEYTPIVFTSYQTVDGERLPIYHTNVMFCLADEYAIICLDAIDDKKEKKSVVEMLKQSNKKIITISEEQMHQFAGNMLQVKNKDNSRYLVMSQSAYQSLTKEQISEIEKFNEILYADVSTIETNGGGSVRCMMAEVFLPLTSSSE